MLENYTDINSKAIDAWVEDGWEWSVPTENNPLLIVNKLPYNPLKDKVLYEKLMREHEENPQNADGFQFSHTMEEQVGGQLKAGLVLTHLYEDTDPPGDYLLAQYVPLYIATRAVKP